MTGGLKASLAAYGQALTLSRNGRAVMRYGQLSASDARGRILRSWISLQGGRVLLHIDAARAAYPLNVDPLVQSEIVRVSGSQQLGSSVAISANGETALVGDFFGGPFSIAGGLEPSGAAYVFVRSGNTWVQQAELTEDEVGFAVGIGLSSRRQHGCDRLRQRPAGPRSRADLQALGLRLERGQKFTSGGNLTGDVASPATAKRCSPGKSGPATSGSSMCT